MFPVPPRGTSCNQASQASYVLKHHEILVVQISKTPRHRFLSVLEVAREGRVNACLETIHLTIDQNVRMFATTVVCCRRGRGDAVTYALELKVPCKSLCARKATLEFAFGYLEKRTPGLVLLGTRSLRARRRVRFR
jgi:hypothetical protein